MALGFASMGQWQGQKPGKAIAKFWPRISLERAFPWNELSP